VILTRDYITSNLSEGVITADLSSWEEFFSIVTGRLLNTRNYIWRGQRSTEWLLESNNNSRLANRCSLFTKSPTGVDIEQWVRKNFSGVSKAKVVLLKLTLPNTERSTILKALNRMNVIIT